MPASADPRVKGNVQILPPVGADAFGRALLPGIEYAYKLPLRNINGMPTTDYIENIKDQILDARDFRLFDTRAVAAGTNLTARKYDFFNIPQEGSETSLDGSVTILQKTANYTNLLENGKVEGGNTMIVDSMQVAVYVSHRDFNAFTASSIFPSTGAPSATDTLSATTNLQSLNYNTYLTFSEPNYGNFAEGNIAAFPSAECFSGAFGGQTTEGWIQIGMGQPQYLRYVRVLQELHHFDVDLTCYSTVTFGAQTIIQIALCGVKLVA